MAQKVGVFNRDTGVRSESLGVGRGEGFASLSKDSIPFSGSRPLVGVKRFDAAGYASFTCPSDVACRLRLGGASRSTFEVSGESLVDRSLLLFARRLVSGFVMTILGRSTAYLRLRVFVGSGDGGGFAPTACPTAVRLELAGDVVLPDARLELPRSASPLFAVAVFFLWLAIPPLTSK